MRFHYAYLLSYRWQYRYVTTVLPAFARNVFHGGCSFFIWLPLILYTSQWFFHFGEEIVITWTQEKMTTLGGTEPHHSSWQCKESHSCCHDHLRCWQWEILEFPPYSPDESVRLRSLCQSERTTARNPVQQKRWTYPYYKAVNTEHHQRWTR